MTVCIHDAVGVVGPRLGLQHFGKPLAFGVGVVPEVEEQEQENQAVQPNDVDKDGEVVEAVLDEEILRDVAANHSKLDLGNNKENLLQFHHLTGLSLVGVQRNRSYIPAES